MIHEDLGKLMVNA